MRTRIIGFAILRGDDMIASNARGGPESDDERPPVTAREVFWPRARLEGNA